MEILKLATMARLVPKNIQAKQNVPPEPLESFAGAQTDFYAENGLLRLTNQICFILKHEFWKGKEVNKAKGNTFREIPGNKNSLPERE